jgi:hypothetical protein
MTIQYLTALNAVLEDLAANPDPVRASLIRLADDVDSARGKQLALFDALERHVARARDEAVQGLRCSLLRQVVADLAEQNAVLQTLEDAFWNLAGPILGRERRAQLQAEIANQRAQAAK